MKSGLIRRGTFSVELRLDRVPEPLNLGRLGGVAGRVLRVRLPVRHVDRALSADQQLYHPQSQKR